MVKEKKHLRKIHYMYHIKCCPVPSKVSKVAKIRNRYNQVPHLTQDTNGKVTNSQKTPQTRAKMTYAPAKFEIATSNKEKMHLQESTLFDLDRQVKVTLNVAQCPLHHVTYAPTEFGVTTSKALGGEAFTRNSIFDL